MALRTLFIAAAVMVITVFKDTTSLAAKHITDARFRNPVIYKANR